MNAEIAVVGIGLNFPGAHNPKEFWDNLLANKNLQEDFPRERFDCTEYQMPKRGYFLTEYPGFDPKKFGIKPNVARQMDPMQWLALDTAKAAFADATISQDFLDSHECGVWCGAVSSDSYAQVALTPVEDYTPHTGIGCDQSMISGRLAYHFNLTGPSLTVNSACSSSLNAVILGAQAIQCGQCDLALVGGVHLFLNPTSAIIRAKAGILSADGFCRSYDNAGNGYALGEGCGFVILEQLSRAQQFGHKIYGLIHSFAQGHNGKNGNFGQSRAQTISKTAQKALANGKLTGSDLCFIEGHGTGTVNGDTEELNAFADLTKAATRQIYLSSVKSHIGHLEAAAGIAGLITALLELNQHLVAPAMNFSAIRTVAENTAQLSVPQKAIPLGLKDNYALINSCGLNGSVASLVLKGLSTTTDLSAATPENSSAKYQITKARKVIHRQTTLSATKAYDWAAILPKLWRETLNLDEDMPIDGNMSFMDLGGDSLDATFVINELCEKYQLPVEPAELLNYPTLNSLITFLQDLDFSRPAAQSHPATSKDHEPIAVIGAVGLFPGAGNCCEFWQNQLAGTITYHKGNDDFSQFPAAYFGYTAREARLIDPQQRLFLYQCWQLLNQTGYWKKETDIGVVAAAGPSTYLLRALYEQDEFFKDHNNMEIMVANNLGSLAGRVSYKLNLCGPAFSLDTHCSSSLVAIDEACQLLHNNRCKMAIAGGVSLVFDKIDSAVISPSGECRPFSKKADGTIFKSGCGAVLLKPLSNAENDGDEILAIIKAARTNQDGANKAGFCAPAGRAQEALARQLLPEAALQPKDISYIEAHGSGTVLGDKLELSAFMNVFKDIGEHKIHWGCVKANIGHCLHASGMASLLKAIYICKTKNIPAFKIDDRLADFESAQNPFIVDNDMGAFPQEREINILVSNLGFGGTNSQLIVSSYHTDNIKNNNSILFIAPQQLPTQSFHISSKEPQELIDRIIQNPSGSSENDIIQILKEASGLEEITKETTFAALGLDSLLLIGLLAKLQKGLAFNLDTEASFSCKTVGELLDKINNTAPRCLADEVIMAVCTELFSEKISGINQKLPTPLTELYSVLKQIYGVDLATAALPDSPTIITISNYLSTRLNLLEIEEKSNQFLKALQNE